MTLRLTTRELTLLCAFAILFLFTSSARAPNAVLDRGRSYLTSTADRTGIKWIWGDDSTSSSINPLRPGFLEATRRMWGDRLPPETQVLAHIQGLTMFDNLYSFNNTLFVVTSDPSSIPERSTILSAGLRLSFDPKQKEANMPTDRDLQVISPQQARDLFGQGAVRLDGLTFMQTDPWQFMSHYFHFVVEIFVQGLWRVYSSLDPHIPHTGETSLPPPRRLIFPHCDPLLWRDRAGLNLFFLRTAFPDLSIEYEQDWAERASIGEGGPASTEAGLAPGQYPRTARALVMDRVVLGDRAAWTRSPHKVKDPEHKYPLVVSRHWWAPVRRVVVEYAAGAREVVWPGEAELDAMAMGRTVKKERPVITYVNRQSTGRRLLEQDHEALVAALEDLGRKYDYEVVVASMEFMNKFDQIYLSSRTTIMLGVHGNGLSSAIWMKPTRRSALIEIIYPKSFVWDYHSVGDSVGIRHWTVWNDTVVSGPKHPNLYFADDLHSPKVPVYAPAVINLIQERLSRPLFDPDSPPEADSVAWWSPHSDQRRPGGIEDQYGYSPSDEEDEAL